MKKSTFLRSLLTLLVMAVWVGANGAMAQATYTHTFKTGDLGTANNVTTSPAGSKTLSNVTWDFTLTKKNANYYLGWDSANAKGVQIGSSKQPATQISLSTSEIPGTITSIVVNTSGASSIKATVNVSVGGTVFSPSPVSLTATATNYTFEGSAEGEVVLSWANTSDKAVYIKSISITYTTSSSVTPTASAPTFTPDGGTVEKGSTVSLACGTEGATIYYAINAADPETAVGTAYTTPITINEDCSITAWAEADGMDASARITKEFVIAKETQTLAFSETSISILKGESFTAPTLTGAQTTVTYSSSNEAVATVDAATGAVTIVGIGTTTITANAAANETYNAASALYTLIVLNPNPYFYKKVVSLSELTEGTVCIFTGIKKDGFYAMGEQKSNNRTAINISSATTLPELISFGSINETNAPYEATIVMSGEKYCFQMSNGKYLINERTDSKNYLKENNGTADSGARWTISLENEELKVYNDNSDDIYGEIRLNTSSDLFSCYKENSQEPITIYRRIEVDGHTTLNISAAGYATFTADKNYIIPAGVEGGIVTVEGTTANVNYVYTEGDIVPANTGLLMKGAQGEYKMYATTQEATEVYAENLLKGALTNDVITAPAGSLLYIFANDSESGLGFYWQNNSNNGQQVQNMDGKAYLQVPTTSAVKGFRLNLGDTTGITAVESTLGNAPVYTLSGVRVNGSLNNLPAGIYIVGGKKVYVK